MPDRSEREALKMAHEHLQELLEHNDFPDNARHNTAVVLSIVTDAIEKGNSLESLEAVEQAIKQARKEEENAKKKRIPKEDIEELRAAWKLADVRKAVTITVPVVIETYGFEEFAYSHFASPGWLADWDCEVYSSHFEWPEDKLEEVYANEREIKARRDAAYKLTREFEKRYDVRASDVLDDVWDKE